VRGICGLIPGVKGLSQNIRVRSILGRYLEHSRIYYFQNHGRKARIYIGSADWMPRNFFRRIEAVFPLENTELRKQVLETLRTYLKDNKQAKQLRPSGTYTKLPPPKSPKEPFSAQESFMEQTREKIRKAAADLEKEKTEAKLRAEPRSSTEATPPGAQEE